VIATASCTTDRTGEVLCGGRTYTVDWLLIVIAAVLLLIVVVSLVRRRRRAKGGTEASPSV